MKLRVFFGAKDWDYATITLRSGVGPSTMRGIRLLGTRGTCTIGVTAGMVLAWRAPSLQGLRRAWSAPLEPTPAPLVRVCCLVFPRTWLAVGPKDSEFLDAARQ